jgi:DNA-binding transcriptional ArsR family regulator
VFDVAVIEDPAVAVVSLDPIRTRLLAELTEPASATALADRVGLARQKVNYHLRELERHGLVELVEERRKGNMIERMLRATAASYVISLPPWPRFRRIRGKPRTGCRRSGCSPWRRGWCGTSGHW